MVRWLGAVQAQDYLGSLWAIGLRMLHLASRSTTHLPLGIHGAILPFILAPLGFLLGRSLGFLKATDHGFIYFGVLNVPYGHVAIVFPVVLIVYYLVWKYLIGFFNQVAGVAE